MKTLQKLTTYILYLYIDLYELVTYEQMYLPNKSESEIV